MLSKLPVPDEVPWQWGQFPSGEKRGRVGLRRRYLSQQHMCLQQSSSLAQKKDFRLVLIRPSECLLQPPLPG